MSFIFIVGSSSSRCYYGYSKGYLSNEQITGFGTAAQRLALPACGRAWTLLESRKNSKPEKCLKMPQNPTRQVHALLGAVLFRSLTQNA